MAKLYVTEFSNLPTSRNAAAVPIAGEPVVVDQAPVTISGSSAASSTFNNNTCIVRLHTDVICSVAFGAAPTAATSNRRMAANQTEYFWVGTGSGLSVAVISNV